MRSKKGISFAYFPQVGNRFLHRTFQKNFAAIFMLNVMYFTVPYFEEQHFVVCFWGSPDEQKFQVGTVRLNSLCRWGVVMR
jgi:hypothetical protein